MNSICLLFNTEQSTTLFGKARELMQIWVREDVHYRDLQESLVQLFASLHRVCKCRIVWFSLNSCHSRRNASEQLCSFQSLDANKVYYSLLSWFLRRTLTLQRPAALFTGQCSHLLEEKKLFYTQKTSSKPLV